MQTTMRSCQAGASSTYSRQAARCAFIIHWARHVRCSGCLMVRAVGCRQSRVWGTPRLTRRLKVRVEHTSACHSCAQQHDPTSPSLRPGDADHSSALPDAPLTVHLLPVVQSVAVSSTVETAEAVDTTTGAHTGLNRHAHGATDTHGVEVTGTHQECPSHAMQRTAECALHAPHSRPAGWSLSIPPSTHRLPVCVGGSA
jgi:hypothetical protein